MMEDEMKIIIFGCGHEGKRIFYNIEQNVLCFCDNSRNKQREGFLGKKVISQKELVEKFGNYTVILGLNKTNSLAVEQQLKRYNFSNYITSEVFWYIRAKCESQVQMLQRMNDIITIWKEFYEDRINSLNVKIDYLKPQCNIFEIAPAVGYFRKSQIETIRFANDVLIRLKMMDIEPFLIGGNLIGIMRHGGFVPWDDDIDFGIFRSDYLKLVQYARENWVILECDVDDYHQMEWIDNMTHIYAGRYVLFVYSAHIQISKGSTALDRKAVDFFVYDYYSNEYSFSELTKYLEGIKNEISLCACEKERLCLVKDSVSWEYSRNIVVNHSNRIYFGVDSCESILRMHNQSYIDEDVILPYKKVLYESIEVNIPNNPQKFISYEYPNWREWPSDFAEKSHNYWRNYIQEKYVSVEFYIVDAFEIEHFRPLYDKLREHRVYAVFIAESPAMNVVGKWINYNEVLHKLNENDLEYYTICNPNVDYAITTQRVECLIKYVNKKICFNYGCSLCKKQFGYSLESIQGFDYKFVHGEFGKEIIKRNLDAKEWEKYRDKVIAMGYPKYQKMFSRIDSTRKYEKNDVLNRLHVKTSKKILGFLPTWGKNSCTDEFFEAMLSLKDKFYIMSKPHHCTVRLSEEKNNMDMIQKISDTVLPIDYDIEEMIVACDLIICSAESGVSLECLWFNGDVKVIFISKKYVCENFFEEIYRIAKVVNNPKELCDVVDGVLINNQYTSTRKKELLDSIFGDRNKDYLEEIVNSIFIKRVRMEK